MINCLQFKVTKTKSSPKELNQGSLPVIPQSILPENVAFPYFISYIYSVRNIQIYRDLEKINE